MIFCGSNCFVGQVTYFKLENKHLFFVDIDVVKRYHMTEYRDARDDCR